MKDRVRKSGSYTAKAIARLPSPVINSRTASFIRPPSLMSASRHPSQQLNQRTSTLGSTRGCAREGVFVEFDQNTFVDISLQDSAFRIPRGPKSGPNWTKSGLLSLYPVATTPVCFTTPTTKLLPACMAFTRGSNVALPRLYQGCTNVDHGTSDARTFTMVQHDTSW